MKNTFFLNILVFRSLINALKVVAVMCTDLVFTCFIFPRTWREIFHATVLMCTHDSLDFVSIFSGCRICAWSLKFYTNQAYNRHVRVQKVGFGSWKKGSVWLQHSRSVKWYFSCRFYKCKKKKNHLPQGQRLKCLNQMINIYIKKRFSLYLQGLPFI